MAPPDAVLELVERFDNNREDYTSGQYNETQLRREFIDPFFIELGWDVNNEDGNAEAYKELAMLLERQGDHSAAAIYFQEGLNLATGLPGAGDVRLLQNSADNEVIGEN